MSQVKLAEARRRRGLWPVMGLFLAIALGAIAYLIAPTVIGTIRQLLPQFSTRGIPQEHVRLIFTFLIFVVLLAFTAFLVAIFMPKQKMLVKETDLKKEREQMLAKKKADIKRQRKINLETQRYLKEKNRRGE